MDRMEKLLDDIKEHYKSKCEELESTKRMLGEKEGDLSRVMSQLQDAHSKYAELSSKWNSLTKLMDKVVNKEDK